MKLKKFRETAICKYRYGHIRIGIGIRIGMLIELWSFTQYISPLKLKVSSTYFCQIRYFQQSRNL